MTAGARIAFDDFSDATFANIAALPEDNRLFYLPGAAEIAYMRAENIDYTAREKREADRETASRVLARIRDNLGSAQTRLQMKS